MNLEKGLKESANHHFDRYSEIYDELEESDSFFSTGKLNDLLAEGVDRMALLYHSTLSSIAYGLHLILYPNH